MTGLRYSTRRDKIGLHRQATPTVNGSPCVDKNSVGEHSMQRLFIVDVESTGRTPYSGGMTEFAVVDFETLAWFHGHLYDVDWPADTPAPVVADGTDPNPGFTTDGVTRTAVATPGAVFVALADWAPLRSDRPVFVSDNPGFDWMWIVDGFDRAGLENPFGWSSRRIGDLPRGCPAAGRTPASGSVTAVPPTTTIRSMTRMATPRRYAPCCSITTCACEPGSDDARTVTVLM